jgi:hypothetical protein
MWRLYVIFADRRWDKLEGLIRSLSLQVVQFSSRLRGGSEKAFWEMMRLLEEKASMPLPAASHIPQLLCQRKLGVSRGSSRAQHHGQVGMARSLN